MSTQNSFKSLLITALNKNNLNLSIHQIDQLSLFLELIQRWNRVYNLTAITDPHKMVYLHIIDSLMIAPYLHGPRLLDIGTGAGLPGIPLAIIQPENHWCLLDKNSKKIHFLIQAIAELGLINAKAIHSRCESFQSHEKFNCIVSRAYASLALFIQSSTHLLAPHGRLIAMKGKYPKEELAIDLPPLVNAPKIVPIIIHGETIERHIIEINPLLG